MDVPDTTRAPHTAGPGGRLAASQPADADDVPPSVDAGTDTALRDRIAEALMAWAERNNSVQYAAVRRSETVVANAYSRADAVLRVLTPAATRAAVLTDAERTMLAYALDQAQEAIWAEDGFTAEDQAALDSLHRLAAEPQQPELTTVVDLTDGPVHCPLCPYPVTLRYATDARAHFTHVHPEQRLEGPGPWPLLATDGAGAQQPDTETLASLFEGLGRLIATSSRDWGTYRVDAWLYAVILGWDCEQAEHDETCVHGTMEEMQQAHGWSDEAVAKARRYRAAVRALTASAVPAAPAKETAC
ncbi:hypothetical protein ACFXAZ_12100 [Streptomyces sp. NPDC059477]|uniref:hypothetical protein n=1 Tax=Streptomyces sp. NPDC059477 TaxID=3346847 RepID=UPI003697BA4C